MRLNPSLTSRLRIGFAILLTLLLGVSLLGVGRLFQVRVDFEDDTTRLYELELQTERARTAFTLEQASVRQPVSRAQLAAASTSAANARERALELTDGDTALDTTIEALAAAEHRWMTRVAEPLLAPRVKDPPAQVRTDLAQAVYDANDALSEDLRSDRDGVRDRARGDTRDTTLLVGAGLAGALLAALVLFSGLINSMRAPLGRLVSAARRLEEGDLETRVHTGGPIEIETLGRAFNEMAGALERDSNERERIERMKDDFVLTVSHELRTPVTVVKGFAEMLAAERRALNPGQREAVDVIEQSAGQLQAMINDLLDLARSDAGKLRINPEPTSARALVRMMGRQMKPSFEQKGQRLTISMESGLPKVEADPVRIQQVLTNLLTNANKYTPEGSRVRLAATNGDGKVAFSVADNGPGLSEDAGEHAFERFWRAEAGESQSVGGTGVGLAIAKSLIELHGGELTLDTTPGGGATFAFTLPAAKVARPRRSRKKS